VHLFWHSFDLALTRFSGRPAPEMTGGSASDREAYSHEVISFGFWAGDQNLRAPAFYSYAYPEPEGLKSEPLRPAAASWIDQRGSTLALLMYDDLRAERDPHAALLDSSRPLTRTAPAAPAGTGPPSSPPFPPDPPLNCTSSAGADPGTRRARALC